MYRQLRRERERGILTACDNFKLPATENLPACELKFTSLRSDLKQSFTESSSFYRASADDMIQLETCSFSSQRPVDVNQRVLGVAGGSVVIERYRLLFRHSSHALLPADPRSCHGIYTAPPALDAILQVLSDSGRPRVSNVVRCQDSAKEPDME